MPLTVIASTALNPQFGASAEAFQRFWIAQSEELARKSTRGVLIRAEGSSHHVHLDVPELSSKPFVRSSSNCPGDSLRSDLFKQPPKTSGISVVWYVA